jgi:hypothetical protein
VTETTIVTTQEQPEEDPSVLAQAAVMSAAVSGAAAATADEARSDAATAAAQASDAQATGNVALSVASTKVDEERARVIAREEAAATLAAALEQVIAKSAPAPVETSIPPEVAPPSVVKANGGEKKSSGRGKWARAWEGQ